MEAEFRVPWGDRLVPDDCHRETYAITGECAFGPCPRGLDRYPVEVAGGEVRIDTETLVEGPPLGELYRNGQNFGPP